MEMVRAAVQTGPEAYEIRELARPRIGDDDGLLRIEACGVCGSDVEQYRGHLVRPGMFPLIPGHEPLGIVEEVGARAAERWGVEPGDRVAVEILRPCRACDYCLTGRYMSCPNRDGAYGMTRCRANRACGAASASSCTCTRGRSCTRCPGSCPPTWR